jgi:hypothetical protein
LNVNASAIPPAAYSYQKQAIMDMYSFLTLANMTRLNREDYVAWLTFLNCSYDDEEKSISHT